MSIAFAIRSSLMSPMPIFAISGWVISSASVASSRARSIAGLISGSRAATASIAAWRSAIASLMPWLSAARKPLTASGCSFDKLARDDDGVGVKVHAVVAEFDEAQVLVGVDADQPGAEADGGDVAEHAVDLALHQHLLAQVRLHVDDLDLGAVDLGRRAQRRKQLQRAVIGRTAELAADEIRRRLDRAVGLDRDREGRAVVEHEDADRRLVRLLGRELDQRVDVAEAHVIGAVGDLRHRRAGTVALIEGDVEACLL